ncbi:MAG: hypothetical protein LBI48_10615 [Burkholderiaceae bacterium]|nr:hypothetical protein [Burkholderiaceae bacterium]
MFDPSSSEQEKSGASAPPPAGTPPSEKTAQPQKATPDERKQRRARADFIAGQAAILTEQINESLKIAHNSVNPETKVFRLEFARTKLAQFQKLAADNPGLTIKNQEGVKAAIDQMASEFTAAGYYAQADASAKNSARRGMEAAGDVVSGLKFAATMQLRTPYRVLRRHGEMHYGNEPPPAIATKIWMGVWLPKIKSLRKLGSDAGEAPMETMPSDIGQIPAHGGDYLMFLKAVRRVVEREDSTQERLAALEHELAKPEWQDFCGKLGGRQAIHAAFFPRFIDTIPGLPKTMVNYFGEHGLTTPEKIMNVPDGELLSIKGIGPAKLKAIRIACKHAAAKESELVDRVER